MALNPTFYRGGVVRDGVGYMGDNQIMYVELPGSGRIEWNEQGPSGVRMFRVNYSDTRGFLDALMGQRVDYGLYPKTVNVSHSRFHPDFPGMFAVRAVAEPSWGDRQPISSTAPWPAGGVSAEYTHMDITVYYERITDYSFSVEFGTEVISVAASNYAGETSGNEPPSAQTIRMPVADIVVTIYASHSDRTETDELSLSNVTDHLGKINDGTVYLFGDAIGNSAFYSMNQMTCAAETLIFESFNMEPTNLFLVNDAKLSYHFRWRRESWNKAYRVDADGASRWEYIADTTSSKRPYDTVDFADILPGSGSEAANAQTQFYNRWRSQS